MFISELRAARECERGGDSFVSEERAALDATLARVGFLVPRLGFGEGGQKTHPAAERARRRA